MSGSARFFRKLAAAALTVAGVLGAAGAVWAGPGFESGHVDAAFEFSNPFTGTIDWAKTPTADGKTIGSKNVMLYEYNSQTGGPTEPVGNVGVLAINTNGFHWDVKMTTKYGGRLFTDGEPMTIKVPADCDDFTKACGSATVTGPGTSLKYLGGTGGLPPGNATANDTRESINNGTEVVLDVAIGAAQKVVSGNFFSVGCTNATTCVDAPKPSRVGKDKVLGSGTLANNNTPTAPATLAPAVPVSFADVFSTDYTDNNNIKMANQDFLGIPKVSVNASSLGLGFIGTSADQHIYVNIGIHPDNASFLDADGNTKYKETFTFTLYNGF